MELTPSSGSCRSLKSLNNVNATQERYAGTSLMMLVLTTPGSATLQKIQERKKKGLNNTLVPELLTLIYFGS